jgi:transposase
MWDNARASLGVAALLRLAECLIGVYSCGEGSSSERRRAPATSAFQLLRLGWYRPVHAKSVSAQEVRSLLTARKLIQAKLLDVECGIRGVLRGFGLKVGAISRGRFELRIRELVDGNAILGTLVDAMLAARTALESEFKRLHRALLGIVRDDRVCRLLMSVPGVGAIVAITFRSGVDDPSRFKHSRDVGPHFGLTPRKYQSGEIDVTGAITKVGDRMVRTALYEAASVMLTRTVRFSSLQAARHQEGASRPGAQAWCDMGRRQVCATEVPSLGR